MPYNPSELPPTEAVRTALVSAPTSSRRMLEACLAWCLVRDAHETIQNAEKATAAEKWVVDWEGYPERFEAAGVTFTQHEQSCWVRDDGVLGSYRVRALVADVRAAWASKSGATVLRVQG